MRDIITLKRVLDISCAASVTSFYDVKICKYSKLTRNGQIFPNFPPFALIWLNLSVQINSNCHTIHTVFKLPSESWKKWRDFSEKFKGKCKLWWFYAPPQAADLYRSNNSPLVYIPVDRGQSNILIYNLGMFCAALLFLQVILTNYIFVPPVLFGFS